MLINARKNEKFLKSIFSLSLVVLVVGVLNSSLNEDPNQQAYQGENKHFPDNNEQNNSINPNGADGEEERFEFDTNPFERSNEVESDDFYGRTREIIIFAKKGKIINNFIISVYLSIYVSM